MASFNVLIYRPQKQNAIRIQTDYDPLIVNSYEDNSSRIQAAKPPQTKYEFKLLRDEIPTSGGGYKSSQQQKTRQYGNSSINITPINNNEALRMRQATSSTYISDQIDRARQEEDSKRQQQQHQSSSSSSSTSLKSWGIIILVFLVPVLIYYFFGGQSISANDEHLYDLE